MGKAKDVLYFNNNKSLYAKACGNVFLGIYNKDDEYTGFILDKCGDMFKWSFNNEIYIIRWFKRKGFCAFYKILNNNVNLKEPEIWSIPESKEQFHKWWEGLEGFEVFDEYYDILEGNNNKKE